MTPGDPVQPGQLEEGQRLTLHAEGVLAESVTAVPLPGLLPYAQIGAALRPVTEALARTAAIWGAAFTRALLPEDGPRADRGDPTGDPPACYRSATGAMIHGPGCGCPP